MADDTLIKGREALLVSETEFSTAITRESIRNLRLELGQSLTEFGLTLKRAVDPKAKRGFSRQYIHGLETGKGRYPITPEIAGALWHLAAMQDDIPAGLGGAVVASVLAQPGQLSSGVFIKRTLTEKRCARPGCKVRFIGQGKYHDEECRKLWAKERRKLGI